MIFLEKEIENALQILKKGKTLLYPTDTIWGIGCDAFQPEAIKKIYAIKQRSEAKSFILLVSNFEMLQNFVLVTEEIKDFLNRQSRPTTLIYDTAKNLPDYLLSEEKTIAIRVVKNDFCEGIINRLARPIISTSANVSGCPPPTSFRDISETIKKQVDYIVNYQQNEMPSQNSQIVKPLPDNSFLLIRK